MQASATPLAKHKRKSRPGIKAMYLYKQGVIGRMFEAHQVTPIEMDADGILFYATSRYPVNATMMLSLDSGHEKLSHLVCKIVSVEAMGDQFRCRLDFEFHLWKQHSVEGFKQLLSMMEAR